MIVMKFGGTSLGTPEAVRGAVEIVRDALARRPLVVVSAHSGVTNHLVDLANRAPHGDVDVAPVVDRHRAMLAGLGLPLGLCDDLHRDLADLVRGMRLVGEASPRARDLLLSFGERCSARIVAACFEAAGIPAKALEAGALGLRTDSRFGRARPFPDDGRIAAALLGVDVLPVVTGFIARDARGDVTTLGRNGSDLSAALFGEALSAEEIQIWTDVDGVLTASPLLVPDAHPIEVMSFDEASEVAYYGGKVLHPATIQPAMRAGIPVVVRNTHRPDVAGTRIVAEPVAGAPPVRSIVYKDGLRLISLVSPRMLMQSGYLARVFGAAAEHEIDIGLVATSEVSITMTTDATELDGFVAALSALGEVLVETHQTLIGVVGHGIAESRGVPAAVFSTLAEEDIRVRVISQGAIKVNVAVVVAEADGPRAVRALHARFFG